LAARRQLIDHFLEGIWRHRGIRLARHG
jgi:hypothetical protein